MKYDLHDVETVQDASGGWACELGDRLDTIETGAYDGDKGTLTLRRVPSEEDEAIFEALQRDGYLQRWLYREDFSIVQDGDDEGGAWLVSYRSGGRYLYSLHPAL